jgi:uncharacterized protein YjbI with pentapeptide repeats
MTVALRVNRKRPKGHRRGTDLSRPAHGQRVSVTSGLDPARWGWRVGWDQPDPGGSGSPPMIDPDRPALAAARSCQASSRLLLSSDDMARLQRDRPTPPRLPPDLPTEPDLRITAGSQINRITIVGDFSNGDLERVMVEDSRIVRSPFTASDLHGLRLTDVLVEGCDFSGADMEEASFTRVTFSGCRMSGALLPRARMQDVSFIDVRLDGVNFRMTEGERVVFDHANLQRGEFSAAHLKTVCFFDCDLSGVDVSQAKLPGARFHGSLLADIKGSEYLRDVVIDSTQVLPLAQGIFAGLNIRIDDDRDTGVR